MNDSLRGSVFVRYSPVHIGCACIVLASRILKIILPQNPPWWLLFDVDEKTLLDICENILTLYTQKHITVITLNIENSINPEIPSIPINDSVPPKVDNEPSQVTKIKPESTRFDRSVNNVHKHSKKSSSPRRNSRNNVNQHWRKRSRSRSRSRSRNIHHGRREYRQRHER
ncbi:hypothetical protein HZS_3987 [Henneguya salminicola]|nr:hypothetical protein HZS_3987 [Henneguya salminicola]